MTKPSELSDVALDEANRQAKELACVLSGLLAEVPPADDPERILDLRDRLGLADPHISDAVITVLRPFLAEHPELRDSVQIPGDTGSERLAEALSNGGTDTREVLWMLLAGPSDRPSVERQVSRTKHRFDGWLFSGWLQRQVVGLMLNIIVVSSMVVGALVYVLADQPPNPADSGPILLRVFAIWVLSFVPGWMFVRFLGQRATALWDEYVVHLHRLGWDRPENLPRPPRTSEFYDRWYQSGGEVRSHHRSVYREKFDAYYGRSVSGSVQDRVHRVRAETLFPVFLLTAVLAVCWTAVLWNVDTLNVDATATSLTLWASLGFAFLGAYSFGIQMLVRRFFQSDLRASAYASLVLRIIVVLVLVVAVHPLLDKMKLDAATQAVVMYVVGFFPLVGLQAMQRLVAALFRVVVPSLRSDYPLSDLDGLSIWYESRLLEEGVEDMQNLATANLVDILLHTRVPVGRLVDWVDQSHLLLHLDRSEQGVLEKSRESALHLFSGYRELTKAEADDGDASTSPDEGANSSHSAPERKTKRRARYGTRSRHALRCIGIRTATDLLIAFPPSEMDPDTGRSQTTRDALAALDAMGVKPATISMLVRILSKEPALNPVWNWQAHEVHRHPEMDAQIPVARPRS